jgi:hypothetical protein
MNPLQLSNGSQESNIEKLNGQRLIVLQAFEGTPKTMLEVSRITKIERASICRYVSGYKKHDQIELVKYGLCNVSGCRAGKYTAKMEGN